MADAAQPRPAALTPLEVPTPERKHIRTRSGGFQKCPPLGWHKGTLSIRVHALSSPLGPAFPSGTQWAPGAPRQRQGAGGACALQASDRTTTHRSDTCTGGPQKANTRPTTSGTHYTKSNHVTSANSKRIRMPVAHSKRCMHNAWAGSACPALSREGRVGRTIAGTTLQGPTVQRPRQWGAAGVGKRHDGPPTHNAAPPWFHPQLSGRCKGPLSANTKSERARQTARAEMLKIQNCCGWEAAQHSIRQTNFNSARTDIGKNP